MSGLQIFIYSFLAVYVLIAFLTFVFMLLVIIEDPEGMMEMLVECEDDPKTIEDVKKHPVLILFLTCLIAGIIWPITFLKSV